MSDEIQETGEFSQDTSAEAPAPTPPSQEPSSNNSDWEARFKGLQPKFQQVQNEAKGLKAHNTRLTNELKDLKAQIASLSEDKAKSVADIEAELVSLREQFEAVNNEKVTLETKLNQRQIQEGLRQTLSSNEQYAELVPFFDQGALNLLDENGQALEGEALEGRLEGFLKTLNSVAKRSFTSAMSGTTPSPSSGVALRNMSADEMGDWLMKNPGHPDYDTVNEHYISAIAGQNNA
jgi:septal ring factor EnvC (AmiA/AmiB activator)